MNRQDKRGRSKGSPPFIKLANAIYDHPAFRALTPVAKVLYLEIRRRYNGVNNGDIHLSVREAAMCCDCGNGTAHRALKLLEDHGFIATTRPGLVHGVARRATTYRLTDEADPMTKTGPTRDFEHWRPPSDSFASASNGTPRVSGGTARIPAGTETASTFRQKYTGRAIS